MPETTVITTSVRAIGTATPDESCDAASFARLAADLVEADPAHAARIASWAKRTTVENRFAAGLSNGRAPALLRPRSESGASGPTTAARMQCYAAHAGRLAADASRAAFVQSGVLPADITHLVVATCTGFDAPGVDVDLIETLGLPLSVARTQVGFMGCHGAVNALRTADAIVRAHPGANVLLVAVELCSVHFSYGDRADRMIANALFADGAAAAILSRASDGDGLRLGSSLSRIIPDTRDAMRWSIGDHGFEMTLAPTLPGLIEHALREPVEAWLHAAGLTATDVAWAAHPGGPKILDAVERGLGLSSDALAASRDVLVRHGNMSSPTVLFVLDAVRRRGDSDRPVAMLGFGPGLAVEGLLLTPDHPTG